MLHPIFPAERHSRGRVRQTRVWVLALVTIPRWGCRGGIWSWYSRRRKGVWVSHEARCIGRRGPALHGECLEPQRATCCGQIGVALHRNGYLGHEDPLVLRGHVFLLLLLAHRGPLELLHQLYALVSQVLYVQAFRNTTEFCALDRNLGTFIDSPRWPCSYKNNRHYTLVDWH